MPKLIYVQLIAFNINNDNLRSLYMRYHHPLNSLLYLLFFFLLSTVLTSIIVLMVVSVFYDDLAIINYSEFGSIKKENLTALKVMQCIGALGQFVLPALLLARIDRGKVHYFDLTWNVRYQLVLYAILIVLVASPMLEFLAELNEGLRLPAPFKKIETWMLKSEQDLALLTRAFLSTDTYQGLILNIVMIGLLAAVGEELLFRGCLQTIFSQMIRNKHLAIWSTAFIFSAFHLQFFGFLPRFLLGALFGYLFLWGRSIWYPIIAHFINNVTIVIVAFWLVKRGRDLDGLNYMEGNGFGLPLLSFLIVISILFVFRKESKNNTIQGEVYGKELEKNI